MAIKLMIVSQICMLAGLVLGIASVVAMVNLVHSKYIGMLIVATVLCIIAAMILFGMVVSLGLR